MKAGDAGDDASDTKMESTGTDNLKICLSCAKTMTMGDDKTSSINRTKDDYKRQTFKNIKA